MYIFNIFSSFSLHLKLSLLSKYLIYLAVFDCLVTQGELLFKGEIVR